MSVDKLREKMIYNADIRNYFLDINYSDKTYGKSFKDDLLFLSNLNMVDLICIFFSGIAVYNITITGNNETLLFKFFLFLVLTTLSSVIAKALVDEDDDGGCLNLIPRIISLTGTLLLGLGQGKIYLLIPGFILSGFPLFKVTGHWIFASIKSFFVREKELDVNIRKKDHDELARHLSKEEMIVFLKNFKKYSDLPLEKMEEKRKECQVKEQERLNILSKEKKIEEYAESLYK